MKYFIILTLMLFPISNSIASETNINYSSIVNSVTPYGISQEEASKIKAASNRSFENILNTHDDAQLRQLALSMNKAEIRAAKSSRNLIPPKLSAETLNHRDKVIEYLRSRYEYKY